MSITAKIRETLDAWRQIIMRTRKPRRDEFLNTFRVVVLAILAIGAVGYVLQIVGYFLYAAPR